MAKLVEHTHTSYTYGALSTMFWVGLRPGDVHVNISSPGWAKHAWSSLFTPWTAEATRDGAHRGGCDEALGAPRTRQQKKIMHVRISTSAWYLLLRLLGASSCSCLHILREVCCRHQLLAMVFGHC